MVNQLVTAQTLTNDFTALGNWIALCTGPPGAGATIYNECSGGSPAYARQETTWTQGTNGSATGSPVTFNLPAGTYPYAAVCQSSSGNTMVDWCILNTPIQVTSQAAIQFTPSATVS